MLFSYFYIYLLPYKILTDFFHTVHCFMLYNTVHVVMPKFVYFSMYTKLICFLYINIYVFILVVSKLVR